MGRFFVVEVANHNFTKYQEGRFIDLALSVLDKNDVHALRLDPSSPEFRKLKSFFKNASVTFEHIKSRKRLWISSHALATTNLRKSIPEK